jgi:hypothetical protein
MAGPACKCCFATSSNQPATTYLVLGYMFTAKMEIRALGPHNLVGREGHFP